INHIYLGISDKVSVFKKFIQEHNLNTANIVYVGDDIPDLPVMKLVGLAISPADAVDEIKEISAYISPKKGGEGVARDIIEKVLKIQNKWFDEQPDAHDGSFSKT
ncbi:3-deoxy-D-manno-octulosonate 8-phosphate phosphatase, partial [Pseudoxanthomonas sp. SGD-10]